MNLIGAGENGALVCGLAAVDAPAGPGGGSIYLADCLIERDVAHRRPRFFFDFGFAVGAAAPVGNAKPVSTAFFKSSYVLALCVFALRNASALS